MNYSAPWSLPGGNLQTIVAAKLARSFSGERPLFLRERWDTPDGDFIDVDWLQPKPLAGAPLWVMFHGLEGSSSSHYALACADYARSQGIGFAVAHFRGCSGERTSHMSAKFKYLTILCSNSFENAFTAWPSIRADICFYNIN